jgi:hypothetical protein
MRAQIPANLERFALNWESPFVQDCVVGLGGLELPTKRLSVASSEQPPSMAGSRVAWASLASPTCRRNGPDSARCSAFLRNNRVWSENRDLPWPKLPNFWGLQTFRYDRNHVLRSHQLFADWRRERPSDHHPADHQNARDQNPRGKERGRLNP